MDNSIDMTIDSICAWIQRTLNDESSMMPYVPEMIKVLAELETARARGVRFYPSTRSASREQIAE